MKQLISGDEAKPVDGQPDTPCSDCPFARTALPGWLGDAGVDEWIHMVHGETRIECHAMIGPQCAGAAIYRANVAKCSRDPSQLKLPKDRERVFASPAEFRAHHSDPARHHLDRHGARQGHGSNGIHVAKGKGEGVSSAIPPRELRTLKP